MKYRILSIAVMFLAFTACKDAPDADKAEAQAPQDAEMATGVVYNVKKDQSRVVWTGTKPTGRHEGTVKLKTGKLVLNDNKLVGGDFTIDFTTITPHDQDEEGNTKLQNHLKSEDFFDVTNHPEGKFEITDIKKVRNVEDDDIKLVDATHHVTGNLTLKGTTKSITFPARIDIDGNEITARADFNIDRTQWDINYGNDKSLGNKYIHPEVNIRLDLVAVK